MVAFLGANVPGETAASLAANLQKLVDANQSTGLKAFIVFTGGASQKQMIEKIGSQKKISIPMTYLPRKDAKFANYQINPAATSTILVARKNRVQANYVNLPPKDFPKVATKAKAMLASAG